MADGIDFPGKRRRLVGNGFCFCCGSRTKRETGSALCFKCLDGSLRMRSISARMTRNAVLSGVLRPVTDFACMDCGAPATVYDHRRYSAPLNVDPVCKGCNIRRGPAEELCIWLNGRRQGEMSAALFPPRKLKVAR